MTDSEWSILEDVFRKHYPRLVRVAMLLAGDFATAEDLVQDALVRARPHLLKLASDEVYPYLRRAVMNVWKNRLRRWALEVRTPRDLLPAEVSFEAARTARLDIWRALAKLSKRQRACIVLRFYEDMSERDAAQVLGISPGSVKRHTSRGLERLRGALADGY